MRTAAWCVVRFRAGQRAVIFPRDGLQGRPHELLSSHRTREAALRAAEAVNKPSVPAQEVQ